MNTSEAMGEGDECTMKRRVYWSDKQAIEVTMVAQDESARSFINLSTYLQMASLPSLTLESPCTEYLPRVDHRIRAQRRAIIYANLLDPTSTLIHEFYQPDPCHLSRARKVHYLDLGAIRLDIKQKLVRNSAVAYTL